MARPLRAAWRRPSVVQRNVALALEAQLAVPVGLAVADEDERQRFIRPLRRDSLIEAEREDGALERVGAAADRSRSRAPCGRRGRESRRRSRRCGHSASPPASAAAGARAISASSRSGRTRAEGGEGRGGRAADAGEAVHDDRRLPVPAAGRSRGTRSTCSSAGQTMPSAGSQMSWMPTMQMVRRVARRGGPRHQRVVVDRASRCGARRMRATVSARRDSGQT